MNSLVRSLRSSRWVKAIYWTGTLMAFASIGMAAANKIAAGQETVPYKTVLGINVYPITTLITIGTLVAAVLVSLVVSHLFKGRQSRLLEKEIRRDIEHNRKRGDT